MTGVTTPDQPSRVAGLTARVRSADAGGWLTTLAVTAVAAAMRLPNLGRPPNLVFDETYYVKDAWTLLNQGYESSWPEDFDASFEIGRASCWGTV